MESYLQIFIEFNFLEYLAAWYNKSVEVYQAHYSNFPEKLSDWFGGDGSFALTTDYLRNTFDITNYKMEKKNP